MEPVELAPFAASLVMQYCDSRSDSDERLFRRELAEFCRRLIAARPGMVSLWNLANDVMRAADKPGTIYVAGKPQAATVPQAASNAAHRFLAFLSHHARRIANETLPYIHSGLLFLTHSYSYTVLAALLRAHEAGKRFGVVCTESRPHFEGVDLARRLAQEGIEVEVIVDAAAAVFIHGLYTLVIGADAVTAEGVANRIGTYGMVLAARSLRVPVYCLVGTEKFLPCGAEAPVREWDPEELVPTESRLHGFNLPLDQTPLELISKFFTEDGPFTAADVRSQLLSNPLHPSLAD